LVALALIALAVLSNVTAVQRAVHVIGKLREAHGE
jgi:hypothetical protein